MQNFSCSALLRCRLASRLGFRLRGFHPLRPRFPAGSPILAVFARRRSFYPEAALPQSRFGLLRVRSPLLAQSLLFSFPPGTEMFQFPGLAPASGRWRALQRVGLPHSDIRGYGGYLPLTAAFRSLSRPSSPPRAKASFMCPSLLSFFLFKGNSPFYLLSFLQYLKSSLCGLV